jgi:hypothetical protein
LELAKIQSSCDFDFLSFEDFLPDFFKEPLCNVEFSDFSDFFFFSDLVNVVVEVVLTLAFVDDLSEDFLEAFFFCF